MHVKAISCPPTCPDHDHVHPGRAIIDQASSFVATILKYSEWFLVLWGKEEDKRKLARLIWLPAKNSGTARRTLAYKMATLGWGKEGARANREGLQGAKLWRLGNLSLPRWSSVALPKCCLKFHPSLVLAVVEHSSKRKHTNNCIAAYNLYTMFTIRSVTCQESNITALVTMVWFT